MFESSILIPPDSVVASPMATAKVQPAMVTVWAMETAAEFYNGHGERSKKRRLAKHTRQPS